MPNLCLLVSSPESSHQYTRGFAVSSTRGTGCDQEFSRPGQVLDVQVSYLGLLHIATCDRCEHRVCVGAQTVFLVRQMPSWPLAIPYSITYSVELGSLHNDQMADPFSGTERSFMSTIRDLIQEHQIRFRFLVTGPSYGFVHSLPSAALFPGTEFIVGHPVHESLDLVSWSIAALKVTNVSSRITRMDRGEITSAMQQWLKQSAKNVLLMGTKASTAITWRDSTQLNKVARFAGRVYVTGHGSDEDCFNTNDVYPCAKVHFNPRSRG